MFQGLTGWHALILLAVILLLFGAAKLPALARSVGQSMKIFKNEVKGTEVKGTDETEATPQSQAAPPASSTETDSKP